MNERETLNDLLPFLEDAIIPDDVLWKLIAHPNMVVKMRLLERPDITSEMLYTLVYSNSDEMNSRFALAVLNHANLSEKTFNFIVNWSGVLSPEVPNNAKTSLIDSTIYRHPLFPYLEGHLEDLFYERTADFSPLTSPNVPLSVLERFTSHRRQFFRELVAMHPVASPKLLEELYWGNQDQYKITSAVLRNPNVPWEILSASFTHSDKRLFSLALENPSIPVDVLLKHLDEGSFSVLANGSLPVHVLSMYATKRGLHSDAVTFMLGNPNITHDILMNVLDNSSTRFSPFTIEEVLRNSSITALDKIRIMIRNGVPHPEVEELMKSKSPLHHMYRKALELFIPTLYEFLEAYGGGNIDDLGGLPKSVQWELVQSLVGVDENNRY